MQESGKRWQQNYQHTSWRSDKRGNGTSLLHSLVVLRHFVTFTLHSITVQRHGDATMCNIRAA